MADLGSGGAGADGTLVIKATDDKVAARLFTEPDHTDPLPGAAAPATTVTAGTVRGRGGLGRIIPGAVAITGTFHPASDRFELGHDGRGGVVEVKGASGTTAITLLGGPATDSQPEVAIGASGHAGSFRVVSTEGSAAFSVAAQGPTPAPSALVEVGHNGRFGQLSLLDSQGRQRILLNGDSGQLYLYDAGGQPTVILDAATGDLVLMNADIAEEFDVADDVVPGSVVRISPSGRLECTTGSYDRRVAGIVSGGGSTYRPGIVLDRRAGAESRRPVAMVGKVTCLVDASVAPVLAGDLLTSSSVRGHAMAVRDVSRAHGAIIGKALAGLAAGRGTVPVLVGLR